MAVIPYSTQLTRGCIAAKLDSLEKVRFPFIPTTDVRMGRLRRDALYLSNGLLWVKCAIIGSGDPLTLSIRRRTTILEIVVVLPFVSMMLGFLFAQNAKANGHPASTGERLLAVAVLVLTLILLLAILRAGRRSLIRNIERLLELKPLSPYAPPPAPK